MKPRSLRFRLVVAGAVAVVCALTLSVIGLSDLFATHIERQALEELSDELDQILGEIEKDGTGGLTLAVQPADPRFSRPYSGLYWQLEGEGQILRSRSLDSYTLPRPAGLPGDTIENTHDIAGPRGKTLLSLERNVILPDSLGQSRVRVTVAISRTELASDVRAFTADLLPYVVILAVALIVAGFIQISIGLHPLKTLGARVAAVRSGSALRLGTGFPDEVQPLAAEVDSLLEARRLEVERARTRAGDLAHGLKTPLQALLGEARRLRPLAPDAADALEEIAATMGRHVDRELARTRIGLRDKAAHTHPAEVASGIVAVLRRTPDGAARKWFLDIPETLSVGAERADLTEALGALAENAARHARERIRISASNQNDNVLITVTDDGPGIPPKRIDALMARGARADESGQGTGLGLAIAAEIAEALGGQLSLLSPAPGEPHGQGLAASLVLPSSAPPSSNDPPVHPT